jgi:serine phosphatase RsbU (regulator of sigma subunit)
VGLINERGLAGGRGTVRRLRLLPAFLVLCGIILDWLSPPDLSAAPFYSAAPMVAAPLLSLPATALTGLAACASDAVINAHYGALTATSGQTEVITIATVSAIAVLINRLLQRSDLRLQSVRSVALAVQRAVLPQPPARIGSLNVAARYEAAQADAQLGGDLYAVQDTRFGLRCIVGDVRGKGLGAIEAVAIVLGAFREAAEEEPTISQVTARLERAMEREGLRRASMDQFEGFTTTVLAEIPPDGSEVRLVNRGHPQPLLLLPDGSVTGVMPTETAVPLGMESLLPAANRIDVLPFPVAATLLLHTDGVTEARDGAGAFYDPLTALAGRSFLGPEELLDAILSDVEHHTGGGHTDDLAMLAITRAPAVEPVPPDAAPR